MRDIPDEPPAGQEVIRKSGAPIYDQGHLAILRGNLASEGCVAKVSGIKHRKITGPARVFDSEEDALAAILGDRIRAGDVVVIRNEGPVGGPGMREMLAPTSAIIGKGLGDSVGLITDGRFFGRHLRLGRRDMSRPKRRSEARLGWSRENDSITIDADKLLLQLHIDDSEIAARREKWRPPQRELRGILSKYAGQVKSASLGAVTW